MAEQRFCKPKVDSSNLSSGTILICGDMKMKVVLISNFSDETVAESLLAEGLNELQAVRKAREWNDEYCNDYSNYYAVVKPDDYRLWRGMADLV